MTSQILPAKLFIPAPAADLVSRPRLLQRLTLGAGRKLTLISAQAGFGKTTLLSEWIGKCECRVCWLSLDERDNDLQRFLSYILAALQNINAGFGENSLLELQSAQRPEIEPFLTVLLQEISGLPESFILVLDDYHVITDPEIQHALLFLLDHMPSQMHLFISSRMDPPWPLARLRVNDKIVEIRSHDLRFTLEESTEYLTELMGLALSPASVAALEKRTEGWIVGLKLAAFSMHDRPDNDAFIRTFTGSHRYIIDYLVEEVLDQLPPDRQDFLLKTSVLTRLNGALCDALLERQNSQAILMELEQKNMFLVALDDERRWYRYHHLFAEILRFHLKQKYSADLPDYHIRASTWYQEHDLLADAVIHALEANNIDRIIELTEAMSVNKLEHRELKALSNWLERMPESVFALHPWLYVTYSWTLFNLGEYEAVEAQLAEINQVLAEQALPDEEANRIRGHAAAIKSYLAELRDDSKTAMQQAEDALARLPDQDVLLRAFVAVRWANCLAWVGELEKAIPIFREAGEASQRVGQGQLAITALSEMAVIQMIHGHLHQAVERIAEINAYAASLAQRDGRQLPAMGILYRHLSAIKRELNELAEAEHYAREAIRICRRWGEKESLMGALIALARTQYSQGRYQEVEASFQEIIQIAGEISAIYTSQIMSLILHYQLLMGNYEQVENWARELGLASGQVFGYECHQDYSNFARYLFSRGFHQQALRIVEALIGVVEQAGAGMFTIRYKTFQAVLLNQCNRQEQALEAMQEALALARAEGYVRSILDEGKPVEELLGMAIAAGIEAAYASTLLTAMRSESRPSGSQPPAAAVLFDPISPREMQVLRFLMSDLSIPEIAEELVISASTARSHVKNIYNKLDVHSRHEAVRKAQALNLL